MRFLFLSFCIVSTYLHAEFVNLEDMSQDFVLEAKQLYIPGYPHAFNPSIIEWNNSMLMSFRTGNYGNSLEDGEDHWNHASDFYDPKELGRADQYSSDPLLTNVQPLLMSFRTYHPSDASKNDIGLVLLDRNFNIISEAQIVDIPSKNPLFISRQQDPRLISVGERMYMVYSNFTDDPLIGQTRRMFVAELHFDGKKFFIDEPEVLSQFEGEHAERWQKNWVPFNYNGTLLLAYSINPHRVLQPVLGTNCCHTVSVATGLIKWDWGTMRGGTPALLLENGSYLAFFHSSTDLITAHSEGKKITHYVMGAYLFAKNPPFTITHISPEPIVGKQFYNGKAYQTWKPLRVIFPGGFIFNNQYIWVVYGRQDHEIWVARLDKKGLMDSLVPVVGARK